MNRRGFILRVLGLAVSPLLTRLPLPPVVPKKLVTTTNVPYPYFNGMSPEVAQALKGMELTTLQWEETGGKDIKMKWMI